MVQLRFCDANRSRGLLALRATRGEREAGEREARRRFADPVEAFPGRPPRVSMPVLDGWVTAPAKPKQTRSPPSGVSHLPWSARHLSAGERWDRDER